MSDLIPSMDIYPYYDDVLRRKGLIHRLFFRALPIPLHTFYPLRYEIYLLFIRILSIGTKIRFRNKKGLLVNIGAGNQGKSNWINIDMVKSTNVNCVFDCRKKLPFEDNSVRGIFTEHFIEHLDYTEEIPSFLSECRRVLEPGGVLRIIVPDAEKYLRAYCEDGWEALSKIRLLKNDCIDSDYKFKYRTKLELINMVFRQGYRHKYLYDYQTLEFVLHRYGFSEVLRQKYKKTSFEELCIDSIKRAAESLYVEAIK